LGRSIDTGSFAWFLGICIAFLLAIELWAYLYAVPNWDDSVAGTWDYVAFVAAAVIHVAAGFLAGTILILPLVFLVGLLAVGAGTGCSEDELFCIHFRVAFFALEFVLGTVLLGIGIALRALVRRLLA
jgi:hypothetical protein